jgi:threonine dehydrogenase-like Zn-dependent dehydrogenase
MRSLQYVRPGHLEWRDVPDVHLRHAHEAIVEPVAASICDIDRPIIAGHTPITGPFAFGHEGVARIVDVGSGVRQVAFGDLVAVTWHIHCGQCEPCRAGHTAHCSAVPPQAMLGIPSGGEWGGLFDDRLRIPYADVMLTVIPPHVDAVTAVSAGDNLSLGYEIMCKHVPEGRRSVLVLGWRAVGLYQVAFATLLGAHDGLYVDDVAEHRAIAEQYGARTASGPPMRDHGTFDLVVDASFNKDWLRRALRMTNPEGVVECLGGYFDDIAVPAFAMYAQGVTLRIARANTGPHVAPTVDLLSSQRIRPELVRSEVVAWDDAPIALTEPSLKPVFSKEVHQHDDDI